MTGARDHDRAREKAGLLQCGQEPLRLGRRIDDIVLMPVDQQEPRGVSVDRRVS